MIKNWNQFITESSIEKEEGFWTLSKEDIKDIMVDFIHNNYGIAIAFGFLERKMIVTHKRQIGKADDEEIKDVFTEDANINENSTPAYKIEIHWNNKTTNDDITDSLHFVCDTIKDMANAEISLHDENGVLDINNIKMEQGGYLIDEPDESGEYELLELEGSLVIFVKEKKKVELTPKFVAEYYGWSVDETKGNNVYLHISLEDLADVMLSRKSDYKSYLVSGEIDDSNYNYSDYIPDTPSIFNYTLNKENSELVIKSLIKEYGGITKLIEEVDVEALTSLSQNDKIKTTQQLEELVIEFLLKERFKNNLTSLCKDSEYFQEIRQTIGDWEANAHIEANMKDIWNEFIYIVDKEVNDYSIIEKDVKKYNNKKEYTESEKFFVIPLNQDILTNLDSDARFSMGSLVDVFKNWAAEEMLFNYDLNPRFSDYGDVDRESLNQEIKSILEQQLGIRSVRKN